MTIIIDLLKPFISSFNQLSLSQIPQKIHNYSLLKPVFGCNFFRAVILSRDSLNFLFFRSKLVFQDFQQNICNYKQENVSVPCLNTFFSKTLFFKHCYIVCKTLVSIFS